MSATDLVIWLCAVLLAAYFLGGLRNRQRAATAVRWLGGALQQLGSDAHIRWLGRAAFQIEMRQAQPPFAALAGVVLLQPRDFPLVWLVNRLRGQHDQLILRAVLRRPPPAAAEAQRGRSAGTHGDAWQLRADGAARALVERLTRRLDQAPLRARRVTLAPSPPHLTLLCDLPASTPDQAALLVELLRDVGHLLSGSAASQKPPITAATPPARTDRSASA
ncbi:hypothetical protein [Kallotenue papyrolyticum]|uniref:hypothetical protein n=1 Tax=Kallotenue papyrolyticum TaxID=1325125 RepID=UPI000492795D|nr:hypothetical protein [Kallotenue papyrolyticum]